MQPHLRRYDMTRPIAALAAAREAARSPPLSPTHLPRGGSVKWAMFTKIGKFRNASLRPCAQGKIAPAHYNDNAMLVRDMGGPHPIRRSNLTCHWRPKVAGGLECYWISNPGPQPRSPTNAAHVSTTYRSRA